MEKACQSGRPFQVYFTMETEALLSQRFCTIPQTTHLCCPSCCLENVISGCGLKLCDFIARLWSSIPEPGNYLCLHCKSYYRDSLSHLVAECSQPLKERFLHDCKGILPPELVDTLIAADTDTFLTIILSASCWSNLDRAMIDSFLSKSFSFVRSCYRNPCEHS